MSTDAGTPNSHAIPYFINVYLQYQQLLRSASLGLMAGCRLRLKVILELLFACLKFRAQFH
jgi:hypothetical protein